MVDRPLEASEAGRRLNRRGGGPALVDSETPAQAGGDCVIAVSAENNECETVTYEVPALERGTYYFQCDVHPNMNGEAATQ